MLYILAIISLVVYLALVGWVIRQKRARRRRSRLRRQSSSHPPMDLRLPEDKCDSCLRWGECNGIAKGGECPWT